MFLVKAKIDGNSMVIPCIGVSPDPQCPGLVRLEGCDLTINNFRATFLTVRPTDIEFVAEGSLLPTPNPEISQAPVRTEPTEESHPPDNG